MFWRRDKRKQFTVNRVDHCMGTTTVELVESRYDGMKVRTIRSGDVVEVVESKRSSGKIRRGDPLEGED